MKPVVIKIDLADVRKKLLPLSRDVRTRGVVDRQFTARVRMRDAAPSTDAAFDVFRAVEVAQRVRDLRYMRDANRAAEAAQGSGLVSATSGYVRDASGNRVRPMTTADLSAAASQYWKDRN